MDPAHRTALGQVGRVMMDIPREPVSLAWHVTRDYLRAGPLRLLRTLRAALDDRIEEKLPHIRVPVAVVCGGRDPLVTIPWADQVARLVGSARSDNPGATLQVVPDGAHALPYERPELFSSLILALVTRAEREAAA
jgi:pimeloyl-ACP methyl ester carboxylesterase